MLFVSAADLSPSDLAALGNNIRPARRRRSAIHDERGNRRVLAAVNRSLARLDERLTRADVIRHGERLAKVRVA